MNYFKITFCNGNSVTTGFNGTVQDAKDYYLNNWFELDESKPMTKGVSVESLN